MQQTEDQIKRVQDKLQELLQRHHSLQKENHRLKQALEEEKSSNGQMQHRLEQLQQQAEIMKTSKLTMSGEEKKAFEKKLTQMVKEIDKCITLLKE